MKLKSALFIAAFTCLGCEPETPVGTATQSTQVGPPLELLYPTFQPKVEALASPLQSSQLPILYVSNSGSDSQTGTLGAPLKTIKRALELAQPGTQIVLRGGTYQPAEYVRIRKPEITLRSHDGEWAVIQCPINNEDLYTSCIEFDVDASGGRLQRIEVIGGFYYGVSFETKWDWGGEDRSGASRIVIEDSKIHDTGRDCIKIKPGCDDITIRRTEIYRSGAKYPAGTPVEDRNAEGIDNVNGDRMVVQDSYIHDISTNGVYFKGGATDCVVERNRIERTGEGGVLIGFDTSPEFFDLKANPGYYEALGGVVRNNLIRDTQSEGIGFYASRDSTAANNTLVNTALARHAAVYLGVSLQDYDSTAKRPSNYRPTFVNNLVAQNGAAPANCLEIRYANELGGIPALRGTSIFHHNLYFHPSACKFEDGRSASLITGAELAAWGVHSATETNSISLNPMLDANLGATLQSPTLGAGACLSYVKYDRLGRSRSLSCDIGADEL